MYRAVEKCILRDFARNNKLLVRVILFIGILLQPVIIIFGPIPGYLYFTSSLFDLSFWFSLAFLLLISFTSYSIYKSLFRLEFYNWIILGIGRKRFVISYISGQTRFSIITVCLLSLGLFRVEDYDSVATRVFLIVVLHLLLYSYSAVRLLRRESENTLKNPYTCLVVEFLKPILFHALLYILASFAFIVIFQIPNHGVRVVFAVILSALLLVICLSTFKVLAARIMLSDDFLKLVSDDLYRRVQLILYSVISFFVTLPLIMLSILILPA